MMCGCPVGNFFELEHMVVREWVLRPCSWGCAGESYRCSYRRIR
uniref:Uncharacterized protein n=1 Tax=Arundo donax TaxID=35708 RepID=A0A0A9A5K4_ARUDO